MTARELSVNHANVVKRLHKSLRKRVKEGNNPGVVWEELIADKVTLKEYANSMSQLARNDWQNNCSENRISWCHNTCHTYFVGNGLQKLVRKQEKTKMFQRLKNCNIVENDEECQKINEMMNNFVVTWNPALSDKLLLLDVGSCFNPFKEFLDFYSIPIDISPADEDVFYCDFLNASFELYIDSELTRSGRETFLVSCIEEKLKNNILLAGVFDIVVFSLLLSYFPSSAQRLECCIKAHRALQLYGLLVIITPDSSHQNRHTAMMKSWRYALEKIGFTRYKYEKLEHLHCMAYQKSSSNLPSCDEHLLEHIYIPQDFQELEETPPSEVLINETKSVCRKEDCNDNSKDNEIESQYAGIQYKDIS